MVTLYTEIADSLLEEKWELLWQLNLNVTCQHFVLLHNFIYQALNKYSSNFAIFIITTHIFQKSMNYMNDIK